MEQTRAPRQVVVPTLQGSYHVVQRGETLWRIARSYGLDVNAIMAVNHLSNTEHVKVGQKLFIPLPIESNRFLWPFRGSVRTSSGSHGVDITAPTGSLIRASRSGRVAVATRQLSGWGTTIVLDHLDGYVTIYTGLHQLLVTPGVQLRQGMPLGTVNNDGLHFEIRYGVTPKNTLALLPSE